MVTNDGKPTADDSMRPSPSTLLGLGKVGSVKALQTPLELRRQPPNGANARDGVRQSTRIKVVAPRRSLLNWRIGGQRYAGAR